ncbi:MAG: hypothetical protein U0946_06975, partial [Patescibacteria group bacterium]|nr:hypothetical protein [Patescibacteria group bacterium]
GRDCIFTDQPGDCDKKKEEFCQAYGGINACCKKLTSVTEEDICSPRDICKENEELKELKKGINLCCLKNLPNTMTAGVSILPINLSLLPKCGLGRYCRYFWSESPKKCSVREEMCHDVGNIGACCMVVEAFSSFDDQTIAELPEYKYRCVYGEISTDGKEKCGNKGWQCIPGSIRPKNTTINSCTSVCTQGKKWEVVFPFNCNFSEEEDNFDLTCRKNNVYQIDKRSNIEKLVRECSIGCWGGHVINRREVCVRRMRLVLLKVVNAFIRVRTE